MSNRVLILGAACGYTCEALRPFLLSAESSLTDLEIVLFVGPGQKLRADFATTQVPLDQWIRIYLRRLPRGIRQASAMCLQTGGFLRRLGLPAAAILQSAFGVAVARYFWYRQWLAMQPGSPSDHVLLSDTRDVIFQSNPFTNLPTGKLFCGAEPMSMGECRINSGWYSQAYGNHACRNISSHPILCSGVIGGPRQLMIEYLEQMCREVLRIGPRILWSSGFDQAIHNHLIRNTPLDSMFVEEHWAGHRLTTLHHASTTAFSIDAYGKLVNARGEVIAIVHQYDRHPNLRDWVDQRWSGEQTAPVETFRSLR